MYTKNRAAESTGDAPGPERPPCRCDFPNLINSLCTDSSLYPDELDWELFNMWRE